MSRESRIYLLDILEAIARIRQYTQGLPIATLLADSKTLDAVIRNLEVIGEAVKMLPEDIRNAAPHVEWKKVAGLRDILIHHYFGIDLEIIGDVVTRKRPVLESQVRELLSGR